MNTTEVDEYDYEDEYKDKKGGWFSNCIGCIVFIPGMTIILMIVSAILKVVVRVIDGILALILILIEEVFRYLNTILAIA